MVESREQFTQIVDPVADWILPQDRSVNPIWIAVCMISAVGWDEQHTHTHCSCNGVYNNLCIISLPWLRCCTMPKPTKSLQNSHSQCMQGPLLRTTFCHVFRVCIQWITGKCCDSQEGLEVENHSPENIYRLKAVVSSHGGVWRWMNAMTCDVLLLAQTFVASLVSSVFFCFPPNPCYPFLGSQKKGGSDPWFYHQAVVRIKKAELRFLKERNHHFWLDIVRRKLKPPPNGVWIDRPKICRVTISLPQKVLIMDTAGQGYEAFWWFRKDMSSRSGKLYFLNWLLRVDVEHFQRCYFYNW